MSVERVVSLKELVFFMCISVFSHDFQLNSLTILGIKKERCLFHKRQTIKAEKQAYRGDEVPR